MNEYRILVVDDEEDLCECAQNGRLINTSLARS